MENPNGSRYQAIILRDVRNGNHHQQQRLVWRVFGLIGALGVLSYAVLLYWWVAPHLGHLGRLVALAGHKTASGTQVVIYFHEASVVLLSLLAAVAVFGLLGLLIFDIQQRNAVIRALLNKSS